jgi:hypothetical protein
MEDSQIHINSASCQQVKDMYAGMEERYRLILGILVDPD